MNLKSPFLIGVQETMRMRSYTNRSNYLIILAGFNRR